MDDLLSPAFRALSARLGQDPLRVQGPGGNTSVKIRQPDLFGDEEEILYVKGSGWDLADIQPAGFAPVRMAHLLKLARLERLSDRQMVNELKTQLTDAGAPTPSVETILHAVLPHRYVDHTHADAVLAISDSRDGEARIRACYGDSVVVIPYVMPGFELARLVAERFPAEAHAGTRGMVLLQHGIFSFGASAEESYNRMIELVARAAPWIVGEQVHQRYLYSQRVCGSECLDEGKSLALAPIWPPSVTPTRSYRAPQTTQPGAASRFGATHEGLPLPNKKSPSKWRGFGLCRLLGDYLTVTLLAW